jgi:hypothetical protein
MVGTDPSKPGAGTTNIAAKIIPVAFNFAGVLITPNSAACGDTVAGTIRTQNSPLFTSIPWSDGVSLGTTQFTDAYQRANFWNFVNTVSPNYHVMLQPVSTLPSVTVDVPLNIGATLIPNLACPGRFVGGIPIDFMDSVVQNIVQSQHITPDTLPIFLTYDMQFLLPQGGFFLGYHKVFAGNQTFAVASYTDPGLLGFNVGDVHVLSHELAEWMDNPLGTNNVPPWGTPTQPCSSQLEVGDPLPQSNFIVTTAGFNYHVQELAYFSWFARSVPSNAVNGRYSTRSSFFTPAALCP